MRADATPNLCGQTLSRLEESVIKMYEFTQEYGGTIDSRTASGIYGLLSNKAYPTLYPARQQRTWANEPTYGHRVAYQQISTGSIDPFSLCRFSAFWKSLDLNWLPRSECTTTPVG